MMTLRQIKLKGILCNPKFREQCPDRQALVFFPLLMVSLLSACTVLRLHDEGRMKTAQEAVEVATSLQVSGFSVFSAMEKNLDAVIKARDKVDDVLDETVFTTFETSLPQLTSADIADELQRAVETHAEARSTIDGAMQRASIEIKNALERQELITQLSEIGPIPNSDLETVVAAVKKRLDWVAKAAEQMQKAAEAPDAGTDARASTSTPGTGQTVLEAIRTVLNAPADDPRVKEVSLLLVQVAQEAALAETKRLGEMHRHLTVLKGLGESFARRHELWKGLFPVTGALIPPAKICELDQRGSFGLKAACNPQVQAELDKRFRRNWVDQNSTLLDFARANLRGAPEQSIHEGDLKAINALGVLLFIEQPRDLRVAVASDVEEHRYSIRLSQLNAEQRLTLIHQLAQGLKVYHEGGIKPEEVAQLALMAGQVGALSFIGTQQ